ncbi:MAG: type IV pilus assembly protein PilP [Alteromonadaceae bacterium]|jgi:type IV pilus assembly protein PilP
MKRLLWLAFITVPLTGCFDGLDDINAYMQSVKDTTPAGIEPIPDVKVFAHVKYDAFDKRSPFLKPKPEMVAQKVGLSKNCLQPDSGRKKQPLERYGLANLKMKGTLGYNDDLWALIESTTDGSLYRVSVGNYLGLFHGEITAVEDQKVQLVEMIPDGAGCWKQRATALNMVESDDQAQGN